ncbi:hypothetical protein LSH36_76g00078 [Paralvinella palmiformis]|uniref:STAS domain-containing protein n=1 Tax=Paralvinella palmiformis TaxID=53620 RepID=A0AAD9NDW2_9ANNE|nr:hypothetical protein LSH36_76g00078 [Paralvinella palmiformis]
MISTDPLLSDITDNNEHRPDKILVEYHGLDQVAFDDKYGRLPDRKLTAKTACRIIRDRCSCSGACLWSLVLRHLPVVDMFRTYKFKEYILGDIIAGISLAVLQVPQSMGYTLLATLPPIIGLYTSFFPVLIYFIFGRSRHVSIGTMALTSLILASSMSKVIPKFMADNDLDLLQNSTNSSDLTTNLNDPVVQEKIQIAMTISFMAGILLSVLSLMKFGILASYISDPFLSGYICGCNIQVLTHQFKHILGITVGNYSGALSYFYLVWDMCLNLKHVNVATLITSVIATAILIVIKKFINERYANKLRVPVPIDIIVVITATLTSYYCDFEARFGVKVVKEIPQGLPQPMVPSPQYITTFLLDAFILGLVNYVLIFIMVKMFSQKYDYPYDPDQEMLATGLAGVFGSFFCSIAGSTSPPRCILGDQAGGKTQLAQLISAMLILLTLLFLAPLLESLPLCILACLVLVSCIPLFMYYKACVLYWHTSKHDLSVWTVSLVATILIGVDIGILIGMSFSVIVVILRTQAPYSTLLGRSTQDNVLLDSKKYSKTSQLSDTIRIFRFEAPLYFATIDLFQEKLFSATVKPSVVRTRIIKGKIDDPKANGAEVIDEENKPNDSTVIVQRVQPDEHSKDDVLNIGTIIVDCTSMTFVDTSGAISLGKLDREYRLAGIRFILANTCETVKNTIKNVKECSTLTVCPSVYDAVISANVSKCNVALNNQENDEAISNM